MRRMIAAVAAGACLALASTAAPAQDYPARPVKIVVPFDAGGPADVYARFLAQRLQEAMGQPFVVENRPGAGSLIGTEAVARSAPDGYTLLLMSNTQTVNESLVPNKPYALMRDFVAVAPINYSDLVLVVNPAVCRRQRCRSRQARQGEARHAQLRVVRDRHAVPHGGRAVQGDGRRGHRPRSVQGQRRRAHGRAGRAGRHDVRCGDDDERPRARRQGEGARHDRGQRPRRCCPASRRSPRPACAGTKR